VWSRSRVAPERETGRERERERERDLHEETVSITGVLGAVQ